MTDNLLALGFGVCFMLAVSCLGMLIDGARTTVLRWWRDRG